MQVRSNVANLKLLKGLIKALAKVLPFFEFPLLNAFPSHSKTHSFKNVEV